MWYGILQVFCQNLLAVYPGLTANCKTWTPSHRAHIQIHGHHLISCTKPLNLRLFCVRLRYPHYMT